MSGKDAFAEVQPRLSQEEKNWVNHRMGNALHIAMAGVKNARAYLAVRGEHDLDSSAWYDGLNDAVRALEELRRFQQELTRGRDAP